ncbi:MAG: hypothetical protein RRZ24_11500 [Clostridia bacterium]
MSYREFLQGKLISVEHCGFDVEVQNSLAFGWQKELSRWALKIGRAALFEDCGLGKTPQELMYAKEAARFTGKPVLILAPLAVSMQTKREPTLFDLVGSGVGCPEMGSDGKEGPNT